MTRQEFEMKCQELHPEGYKIPTTEEYKAIEYVYNFHPSISETEGKQQIAMLYTMFGMGLIRDMILRANEIEKLEDSLRRARAELDRIENMIKDVREGGEI